MMTLDFYQENQSEDLSPSSREIEELLGKKIEPGLENLIDSMTGKQTYDLLCEMLSLCR